MDENRAAIETLVDQYENKRISRRELIVALLAGAAAESGV